MIIIVTQVEIELKVASQNIVSIDRAIIQVKTVEMAIDISSKKPDAAAPVVTFVNDMDQLNDLLDDVKDRFDSNIIIIFDTDGFNFKDMSDYFESNMKIPLSRRQ